MILQTFVNLLKWETEGEEDLKEFEKRIDAIAKKTGQQLARGLQIAGAAATAFGVNAFRLAADAEELDSKLGILFKDGADDVREWADITGNSINRATSDVAEAAVGFQTLFQSIGDPEEARKLSQTFAQLSFDVASQDNLDDADALTKLLSGLSGEAEPLRRLGVFITAAKVESELLAQGARKVNGAYTDQQKILARAAIIQRELARVNGDAANTADSAANTVKGLSAEFKELSEEIGRDLIPVVVDVLRYVRDGIRAFKEWNDETNGLGAVIVVVVAAIGALVTILQIIAAPLQLLIVSLRLLIPLIFTMSKALFALALNPVGAVILLIAGAIAALILIWKNWDRIVANFRRVFDSLPGPVQDFIRIMTGPMRAMINGAIFLFQNFDSILSGIINTITNVIEAITNAGRIAGNFVRDNPFALAALGPAGLAVGGAAQAARTVSNIRNNNGNSVSQTVNAEINVRGGNTNAQTGAAVRDALYDGPRTARLNRDLVGPVGL